MTPPRDRGAAGSTLSGRPYTRASRTPFTQPGRRPGGSAAPAARRHRAVVAPARARAARAAPRPAPKTRLSVVRPAWKPRPNSSRRRLAALLLVLVLLFVVVGIRLVDVQAMSSDHYAALGADQRLRSVELAAERGSIFDRNGADLAVSVPQQTVWANPRVVADPTGYAALLAPVLGIDEADVAARLAQKDKGFVYLARKVDDQIAFRVAALKLDGVELVPETKRFYPGDVAAPLLGFVGTDNDGLGGLESQYEHALSGRPGKLVVERDPQGRELPGGSRKSVKARRGRDLVLTLDRALQYRVEQILTEEVTAAGAKGATAIVMDTQTGDVLAMATVDGATDGQPAHAATASEQNRPLTSVYEPGSTNKVVTVAAAIDSGLVDPGTWFETPPALSIDGTNYEDVEKANHPPSMTVADIVRESSNVGTIKIAQLLGKEHFDAYLRAFGYGTASGLGYPGESTGILLPLDQYNDTSLASMPIGNGIAVTSMQMLDVFTTIANGGETRPPRLVDATVDAGGARHEEPAAPSHRVVSPETAAAMRVMLEGVVQSGTGTKAAVDGYRVAGKTGTARKPPYDKPPYRYTASFAGFAPASSPRLSAIVVFDEPTGERGFLAGQVAAPAFSRIMAAALRSERVSPDEAGTLPATP